MPISSDYCLSRRRILYAGAGLATVCLAPGWPADADSSLSYRIRPAAARAPLLGAGKPATHVWAYDGKIPGPALRLRQGRPVRIHVKNGLDEGTTVHCHGIRLPNAMDGVPGLTQPLIKPGASFIYEFTPPDAGTFWYHPHADTLQQLGRGLAGALIVEEPEPVAVDHDLLWVLADWRLTAHDQIATPFEDRMDAAMSGRIGNVVTLNGSAHQDQKVRVGERIRLRLLNAAVARIMALRFEGHRPVVVAIDGQPCDPHEADGGRLILGPAMRIDVAIDMQGEPGRRYPVVDDFYNGLSYTLTNLAYSKDAPIRAHPLSAPLRLPRNPVPEPDLANAEHRIVRLQGGMMGGGMMSGLGGMSGMATPGMNVGPIWAINGVSMTGDGQAGMRPLFTFKRGRSVVLTMRNETAWWHPMHFHGYSFRILRRNGSPVPYRQFGDTVLMAPRDVVDCAFVADNPGNWMLHCHIVDHQMAGMMTVLRVL